VAGLIARGTLCLLHAWASAGTLLSRKTPVLRSWVALCQKMKSPYAKHAIAKAVGPILAKYYQLGVIGSDDDKRRFSL
jgi:hypothetical protein